MAAHQVGQQRGRTLVAHRLGLHTGLLAQHQRKKVRQAAGGGHANIGLGRVGLQPGQQVLHLFDRHGAGYGHAKHIAVDFAHRHKVFVGVVPQVVHHQGSYHHYRWVGQHQHGLRGRGIFDILGRHAAACAHFVFHNHRLPQAGLQLVGHNAGDTIGRAARRVANDDAQHAVLCLRACAPECRSAHQRGGSPGRRLAHKVTTLNHGISLNRGAVRPPSTAMVPSVF